ncbi:MAG: hypothetical protein LR017_00985 [Candidatus Pacebacteria bacterium]|nr:hypothetical protein [Candidatus Paceibacterota bacterium]
MSEVLHANIFFFVTSIAVIVFTLLLCIAIYHVIKILKSVQNIIDRIEAGSEVIAEDVSNLRSFVANGGFVSQLFSFILNRGAHIGFTKKSDSKKHSSGTRLVIKDED